MLMTRMSHLTVAALTFVGSAVVASDAHAATVLLQNDSWVDNALVAFQQGFTQAEAGAVTLGPVTDPYQVQKVQFLFGGAPELRTLTLEIYRDNGGNNPGLLLFTGDYQVQGADDALQEIDLSAESVFVSPGSIRVALRFQHDGFPSIARDTDGINAGRNWINSGNWQDSSTFGVQGDWIIRAEVETSPSGTGGAGGTGAGVGGGGGTTATTTAASTAATGAGGSTGSGMVCTPGQSVACVGPGACDGGQTCGPDGMAFGACECGEPVDDEGCSCRIDALGSTPSQAPNSLALVALAGVALLRRRS